MYTSLLLEIFTTDTSLGTSLTEPSSKPEYEGFILELKSGYCGNLTHHWDNGNKSKENVQVIEKTDTALEMLLGRRHRLKLKLLSREKGIWDGNQHVGGDVRMMIAPLERPTTLEIFGSYPDAI